MADGLADRSWIDVQKKTFTNWTNNRLKGTDRQVNDLQTDLDDGVILIKLLEALAPKKKMPGKCVRAVQFACMESVESMSLGLSLSYVRAEKCHLCSHPHSHSHRPCHAWCIICKRRNLACFVCLSVFCPFLL